MLSRLPANENLERKIEELLTRLVGRPSRNPVVRYEGFLYQAASWRTAGRAVVKIESHAGELLPRVGFIVSNLELPSRAVVRFYPEFPISWPALNRNTMYCRIVPELGFQAEFSTFSKKSPAPAAVLRTSDRFSDGYAPM